MSVINSSFCEECSPKPHSNFSKSDVLSWSELSTFQFQQWSIIYYSRDFFGEVEEIDIVPGGREKSVTVENRHEYVKAYVDYYMNKVIEAQYEAFAHVS